MANGFGDPRTGTGPDPAGEREARRGVQQREQQDEVARMLGFGMLAVPGVGMLFNAFQNARRLGLVEGPLEGFEPVAPERDTAEAPRRLGTRGASVLQGQPAAQAAGTTQGGSSAVRQAQQPAVQQALRRRRGRASILVGNQSGTDTLIRRPLATAGTLG